MFFQNPTSIPRNKLALGKELDRLCRVSHLNRFSAEGDREVLRRGEATVSRRETEGLRLRGLPTHPRKVHQHVRRSVQRNSFNEGRIGGFERQPVP